MQRKLNILTWHVHGNYLYYLSQIPHNIYLPVTPEKEGDYMGKGTGFAWGSNVIEIPHTKVPQLDLDCIIFQRPRHYFIDQYSLFSPEQRRLPRVYIEHDPPQQHPTNTLHWVQDPDVLVVHVTHFNQLMWSNPSRNTAVIPHGVLLPERTSYSGELEKGIVVINNIRQRGRRLGLDIYEEERNHVPLDLIGMNSEEVGGLGEVSHEDYPSFISKYRFFFNPIRYTSLGLAVCEAMTAGLPVVGLATTEMVSTVENGVSGYVSTNVEELRQKMQMLIREPETAKRLGQNARKYARKHFGIDRFVRDWTRTLENVTA